MITLNSDVMRIITQFLDPVDCARMAKVSKGWATYMYRNEIWNKFNWKITTEATVLGITDKSVHCGAKRKDCFWNWISRNYSFRNGGVLSLNTLWRIWLQQNKPCKILFHHLPETCFLYNMEEKEKQHFLKNNIIYGSSFTNSYHQYLERVSRSVWLDNGGRVASYWLSDQNKIKNKHILLETDTSEKGKFESKLVAIDLVNLQKIIEEFTALFNTFQGNLNRLRQHTDSEFRNNHEIINNHNNLAWNNIIFEVGHVRLPLYL